VPWPTRWPASPGNINPALYTLGGLSQVSSDAFRTGIVE